MRHNEHMEPPPPGARRGSRRAVRQRRPLARRAFGLLGGALVAGVAWAVLVYAGIRFGQSARGGDGLAWLFLLIAALGAVACLFLALMLGSHAWRSLGSTPRTPADSALSKGRRRAPGKRAGPRR